MNKRFTIRSLSVQLLGGVLLSLLIALLSFGLFFALGNELLDHTLYGESFSEKITDRQFKTLQDYVTRESVTTDSLHRLNAWFVHKEGVYLTLYQDGELLYESPSVIASSVDAEDFDPSYENTDFEYDLSFADGVKARAFMYYFASDSFFYWMTAVSGLMAFAVFALCLTGLVHRKLRYIQKLKNELDIMASGDLSRSVTIHGQDELSELAVGIDEMRRSILEHQSAEEEMRSANSRLVTAMSHDLRTPLTALLAYLEILARGKAVDEEQRDHLIQESLERTVTIKAMADKLFEYFFVYTSEWEQPEMEELNADEVFGQFWNEYAFALESHGFTVKADFRELDGTVLINTGLIRRAFDNLYANVLKYADKEHEVNIRYRRDEENVVLIIENTVSGQRDRVESTNIGLNTCRRILDLHNGTFSTKEEGDRFTVVITLPVSLLTAR